MIDNFPDDLKPRKILRQIIRFLDEKEIILLYGMRQTGKTHLLYLIANYFIKNKKVDKKQIVYFDLENIADFEKLEKLKDFNDLITILKKDIQVDFTKKVYVFIDEIQYLTSPSSFLKYLYDHHKEKIKFIVTGSSSLEIKKKFTDALTGRVFRFELEPLSYEEFLNFKKLLPSKRTFSDFVIYGGFPAVSLKKDNQIRERLLKEIYSLYIRRDIRDLGNIEDVISFNKLGGVLAAQIGGLLSDVNLANVVAISRPTIRNYLFLLENTFVVYLLLPFFTNPKKEITKMPKVYFNDTGIRNAVLNNFTVLDKRIDMGALVENTVFAEFKKKTIEKIHFWRSDRKQEVDFIIKNKNQLIPIEVKYQSMRKVIVPSNLAYFIKKYKSERAYVLTKELEDMIYLDKTQVIFYPCWKLNRIKF
ncbi:hypothetical protein A2767_07730 [Candidatus Roizmanbacteria bacterium RIFCSPHIGHO2_01_FULL_35_10]|uniref:AAA+ ATPase domain-containing protein n=1 Tax=Candidatus Roizmanbacteria bacterium RIFCSPLOWO2_01_FULL_35_13 TaxID=1802055 RepID=A0A1F7ICT3_9BACT|nr:MAG: hypothetical protein A2767_07730 [Candidatus Roizmanbacteria bacterium RIFCSPHIGHO2_01_FULL_35_10]OGK41156.1 MAG: hypothetical protein A3A74_02325 [Candidatus Roizmanbacteria bacterium RIFCSPLOWO2_01_FULL_35_13]